ncbi:FeoA family protein [Mariniblastus fucicola]|uniref:FeoA domain protein n=1 Tax=Mariniblastus fucicola TaxID=980251 RepID=A0A5B9PEH3_9BACT|nr:ferrous iron transport protein A [Mariniblastus fucicola]QEG25107.1 FeoA domain protein [Mariniblastus fucicola]
MNVVQQYIQLRELQSGQIAKVMSISGDPREIARVAALGLRTGEVISVTRGGITCIVQFCNGNRFCLRMSDSLEILVKTI